MFIKSSFKTVFCLSSLHRLQTQKNKNLTNSLHPVCLHSVSFGHKIYSTKKPILPLAAWPKLLMPLTLPTSRDTPSSSWMARWMVLNKPPESRGSWDKASGKKTKVTKNGLEKMHRTGNQITLVNDQNLVQSTSQHSKTC